MCVFISILSSCVTIIQIIAGVSRCPVNTYGNVGSTTCSACNLGTYCPAGAVIPSNCPSGFYCPAADHVMDALPRVCPMGSFCNVSGLGAATPCLPGFICPLAGLSSVLVPCPIGSLLQFHFSHPV